MPNFGYFLLSMVLRAGLEPARIAPHAPQTCAATNYATSAEFSIVSKLVVRGRLFLSGLFGIWTCRWLRSVRRGRPHICVRGRSGIRVRIRDSGWSRGLGNGFSDRIEHRNPSAKCRQREQKRRDHKHRCCGNGHLRKDSCRSARIECRTRYVARKERTSIGLARLKQNRRYQHKARDEKQCIENVDQIFLLPQSRSSCCLIIYDLCKTFGLKACPADKCTINIHHRHQSTDVVRFDRTSV